MHYEFGGLIFGGAYFRNFMVFDFEHLVCIIISPFYSKETKEIWFYLGNRPHLFFSVLTRILPWGVPGPPLLRNRGPVRTLGGQSYKKHAVLRT